MRKGREQVNSEQPTASSVFCFISIFFNINNVFLNWLRKISIAVISRSDTSADPISV